MTQTSKTPKTPKAPKAPAHPWLQAIALVDTHGLARGTPVAVRKSRQGGWRILLEDRIQLVVADFVVKSFVVALRGVDGKPVPLADQTEADKRLQGAFKAMWLAKQAEQAIPAQPTPLPAPTPLSQPAQAPEAPKVAA